MLDTIRRTLYVVLIIWTVVVLFIVYKNIEFPFVFQFVIGYVIFLLLTCLYFTITIFLNIRNSKWSIIRKMLLRFIIGSLALWILNILLAYLIKGELRIMDEIIGSIIFSFCLTFGELIFEKKNGD